MLFSIVALLAFAIQAFAASPAAATYCSEDNLLRAFQHTPTPASTYCSTPIGYPTFLAVSTYPPSRLSSACSCYSRFPTDYTLPQTCYKLTGTGYYQTGTTYSIVFKLDKNQPCGTGYKVIGMCGTVTTAAGVATITLDTVPYYGTPDFCFDTTTGPDGLGVNFDMSGDTEKLNIHSSDNPNGSLQITGAGGYYEFLVGPSITAISCPC